MKNFNLYLNRFESNGLKLKDVIYDFETGINPNTGIRTVMFNTKDKYVNVMVNTSIYSPNTISGSMIIIMPVIEIDGETVSYEHENVGLLKQYYEHPDFFMVEIVVPDPEHYGEDTEDVYTSVVTPLKNGYIVTYIPWDYIHNMDTKAAELIELDYE